MPTTAHHADVQDYENDKTIEPTVWQLHGPMRTEDRHRLLVARWGAAIPGVLVCQLRSYELIQDAQNAKLVKAWRG